MAEKRSLSPVNHLEHQSVINQGPLESTFRSDHIGTEDALDGCFDAFSLRKPVSLRRKEGNAGSKRAIFIKSGPVRPLPPPGQSAK